MTLSKNISISSTRWLMVALLLTLVAVAGATTANLCIPQGTGVYFCT